MPEKHFNCHLNERHITLPPEFDNDYFMKIRRAGFLYKMAIKDRLIWMSKK